MRTTWTTFVGVSTCAPRGPHLLRRRVNICSRHCNSASGYDADYIGSCGGCSGYVPAVPSLSPHLVPYVYTCLLCRWCHVLGENFWGTLVCVSSCFPHFLRCKIRLYWNFSLIGWRLIVVLGVENWRLKIILPRSCI